MLIHESSQREICIRKRSSNAEFLRHPPGQDAPQEIFGKLASEFPDYLQPNRFDALRIQMKLPIDHPDLDRLLAAATQLGLAPQKHRADLPTQIEIRDFAGFSAAEIESADFVECMRFSPFIVSSSQQDSVSVTRIASDRYIKQSKNKTIGSFVNLYHLLAVRGVAKAALEEANLIGLELLPLVPDSGEWTYGIEPLHLVWSSHELPPVEGELFVDGDYEIFRSAERDTRALRRPCHLLDGCQASPQLRYCGLDPGTLDVGVSREWIGGPSDHYRKIIYSQRARRVLEDIDKNFHYRPVIAAV